MVYIEVDFFLFRLFKAIVVVVSFAKCGHTPRSSPGLMHE